MASDSTKSVDIEAEIKRYEQLSLSLKEEAELAEKNASEFKTKIEEKENIITTATDKIDALNDEKQDIVDSLNALKLERDTMSQRAEVLQRMNEHFEGYSESTKFVMREYNAGNISGGKIHGPLSTLINVEKKYITAIETALGASLQNIVVDNEEVAKSAMYALKRANAGRATFYPISAIRAYTETDEIREAKNYTGYVGRADELVQSSGEYRAIIEWLLLRTVVFDNIEDATVAAKKLRYRVKIVTLDGQLIGVGGAFTGGSSKRDSGILSRLTEITTLKEKAADIGKKIKKTEDALAEIYAETTEAEDKLRDAEQERDLLLSLSRSQFAALDSANAKYEANNNILEKLREDYDNLAGRRSEADEEIKKLEGEFSATEERISALKSFRTKKDEEKGILDEKSDEIGTKAADAYINITEVRKDIESIQQMIDSYDLRIEEQEKDKEAQDVRISEITSKRDNIDNIKAENKAEHEALRVHIDELVQERRETEAGGDEFERELMKIRQMREEKSRSRDAVRESQLKSENRCDALREKQDKLGHQLWDEYEINYEDAVALGYPEVTAENREEVAALQVSCKNKLRALGGYNPSAIEEYAEVKVRYDGLNAQYVDLTSSHEELLGIINRLEEEMRTSFIEAFEAINHNFGITFKELFGGGNAELSMTDPEDVLTSGIEIKAAPPGKIIKNLALLSGGEQSFVAIALLFAILKVNPTPFCILDEIEAALDEVNVFRFGEYIKRFDDGTQFILITHRRGTMEIGDRLYGVTMPQRGISQAIELNVNEIEGKQKELLDGVL